MHDNRSSADNDVYQHAVAIEGIKGIVLQKCQFIVNIFVLRTYLNL